MVATTSRRIHVHDISGTQHVLPASFEHERFLPFRFEFTITEVCLFHRFDCLRRRGIYCDYCRSETDKYSSGAILDEEGTEALCIESCFSSLESARSSIVGACTASSDLIVEDEVAYPGIHACSPVAVSSITLLMLPSHVLCRQLSSHVQSIVQKGQVHAYQCPLAGTPSEKTSQHHWPIL